MDERFSPEVRPERSYHAKKLYDHHQGILRLLVASNGHFTNEAIANIIGCTPQTVCNVRNSDLGKVRLAEMHKKADDEAVALGKRIMEAAPVAVDMLEKTMKEGLDDEFGDKDVRSQAVRASLGVLDHAHPKTTQSKNIHAHVTVEQLDEIKERHNKARAEEADMIEAEVVTVEDKPAE